jgi:hypothetical protein
LHFNEAECNFVFADSAREIYEETFVSEDNQMEHPGTPAFTRILSAFRFYQSAQEVSPITGQFRELPWWRCVMSWHLKIIWLGKSKSFRYLERLLVFEK